MEQRAFKIIVVMLFFSFHASAQYIGNVKSGERNQQTVDSIPSYGLKRAIVSPTYYINHLGFFCRQELKIEKAISLPIKFRIGSIDHVNYLERKPNAVMPAR
jgi:hypothetical protein